MFLKKLFSFFVLEIQSSLVVKIQLSPIPDSKTQAPSSSYSVIKVHSNEELTSGLKLVGIPKNPALT